jgi:5-methylcytosine-specific restriction endonuclease McrA
MKRIGALFLGGLLAIAPETALARSHHSRSRDESRAEHSRSYSHHATRKRDPVQRRAFQHAHPCPATGRKTGACPGYVVDHIKPLKRGGPDRPSNMQWQTRAEAKAKDRWE